MPSELQGEDIQADGRLRIRVLGAAEVILDGRRRDGLASLRLQRFLARVVLRREPQNRASLAFELWPDSTEAQARTNLRKLLHQFRKALPDADAFVEVEGGFVAWRASAASAVDALCFREAVTSGDFERAARLYKGELLPDCYDEWVLREREVYRSEAIGVYKRLSEDAVELGDHQVAIAYAKAICEIEPSDEFAVRVRMEAHHALGDHSAAMRAFDRHAEFMRDELGADPAAELEALRRKISAKDAKKTAAQASRAPQGASPFVGRDAEWDSLIAAWRTSRAGQAHFALLTGEPGIGKSRLALELGQRVKADGFDVSYARAYEAAGRLPWGPIVEMLRSASFRNRIDALDNVWSAELAPLLPELSDRALHGHEGRREQVAQRHRLFDAVSKAIASCGAPQLLVMDDLQWCGPETIEFLGYFIRSNPNAPVLIVGTARWTELSDDHQLPPVVDALQRDRAVTVIPVAPLDEVSTKLLAAELRRGDALDDRFAAKLWSETEGNPLFVIESIRAIEGSTLPESILTPTMRTVLRARLAQLSEKAQQLVELAAVFGQPFSTTMMAIAADADEWVISDQLDELWRGRIVIDQGQKFDFSHDKLREAALEMINPARRRRLHKVVAEAIAQEHSENAGARSAQLAAHYDQAGLAEQAIDAYRAAGARAVATSALDDAVSMFRRALALLAELPGSKRRDAIELDIRIALGSPLVAIEGYGSQTSLQLYERAMSLCRKLGHPVEPPILRGLGLGRLQGCRFDDSSGFAQALIEHERQDQVSGTEGRYLMGVSTFWQGDLKKSKRYLEAAIQHYDVARRDEHLARYAQDPKAICLIRLAMTELWSGEPAKADKAGRAAAEISGDLDHLMTSAYVATYGAILSAEADDLQCLTDILDEAHRIWSRLSERYLWVVLQALRGWLDVRDGADSGVDRIVDSVARSRRENESLHLTYTLLLLARARAMRGEWRESRSAIRDALTWSERRNQRYLVPELLRVDGECAYNLGEADEAETALRRSIEVARAQGADWHARRALDSLSSRFPEKEPDAQHMDCTERPPARSDLAAFRGAVIRLGGVD